MLIIAAMFCSLVACGSPPSFNPRAYTCGEWNATEMSQKNSPLRADLPAVTVAWLNAQGKDGNDPAEQTAARTIINVYCRVKSSTSDTKVFSFKFPGKVRTAG